MQVGELLFHSFQQSPLPSSPAEPVAAQGGRALAGISLLAGFGPKLGTQLQNQMVAWQTDITECYHLPGLRVASTAH